jgi:capsular exopolysaccharide synthesis family protein
MPSFEIQIVPSTRPASDAHTVELPAENAVASEWVRFADFLSLVARRKFWLVLFAVAGAAAGYFVARAMQPVFEARASLEVLLPNEDYLNRRQLDPTAASSPLVMESYLQTQIKLLESDALLWRVAESLHLSARPEFQPAYGLKARLLGQPRPVFSRSALLEELHERLNVRLFGQTNIVELRFRSADPEFAALFANTLAREFTALTLRRRSDATGGTAASLSSQLSAMKNSLDESERALETYIRANGPSLELDRENVSEARLRLSQQALGTAREARVAAQTRYERSLAGAQSGVFDNDTLRAYRVRLAELRQKQAEESQVYKPGHYRLDQLRSEIAELEKALAQENASALSRLRVDFDAARERERLLTQDYDTQMHTAAGQSARSVRYGGLKREVETRRQVYESTLEKLSSAEVASSAQASNLHVLDEALAPLRPVKPNKPVFALVGLLGGLLIGLVGAARAERRERRVDGPSQLWRDAGVPLLGVIPSSTGLTPAPPPGLLWRTLGRLFRAHVEYRPDTAQCEDGPEVTARRHQAIAEACRNVLASVLYTKDELDRPRLIAVASANRGEGRTSVACNLAFAMAQCGRRVLLADADTVNPHLHEALGVLNHNGLADLLKCPAGQVPDYFVDAPQPTLARNLSVLPIGCVDSTSLNLVDHARATELFETLRHSGQFDAIFIDTPPVLATSDARAIARMVDSVVFVSRAHFSNLADSRQALRRLLDDGAHLSGTVLNDVTPSEAASL